jgi:hypothetical protein
LFIFINFVSLEEGVRTIFSVPSSASVADHRGLFGFHIFPPSVSELAFEVAVHTTIHNHIATFCLQRPHGPEYEYFQNMTSHFSTDLFITVNNLNVKKVNNRSSPIG